MSRPPKQRRMPFFPARLGPKAAEDEDVTPSQRDASAGGLTLRAMLPNAITAAALCSGLTGIRFATEGQWAFAIALVLLAGVLDGIDGRVARLLNAQSRFGAELDSLADSLSFGVAPALILYMWSLKNFGTIDPAYQSLGWFAALGFAICCALRLARFNAQIDTEDQPHKSAGFVTGVPAPAGAGLAFTPFYLWTETELEIFRNPVVTAIWLAVIAVLMISNMATLSWASIRPRKSIRLGLIAFIGLAFAALLMEPWWTLSAISVVYLALMPYGLIKYGRIKQRRRQEHTASTAPQTADPA